MLSVLIRRASSPAVYVVWGAAGGIGAALSKRLAAQQGATVVQVDREGTDLEGDVERADATNFEQAGRVLRAHMKWLRKWRSAVFGKGLLLQLHTTHRVLAAGQRSSEVDQGQVRLRAWRRQLHRRCGCAMHHCALAQRQLCRFHVLWFLAGFLLTDLFSRLCQESSRLRTSPARCSLHLFHNTCCLPRHLPAPKARTLVEVAASAG